MLVGDRVAPSRARPPVAAGDALAEHDGILGGAPAGPQGVGARRAAGQRGDGGEGVGAGQHGHGGDRGVELVAGRVQQVEGAAVGGQRPAGPGGALPGHVGLDVEPHDLVAAQGGPDALGEHRAAAQGQRAQAGALEQLEHEGLLLGAEGRLAVAREDVGHRRAGALLEHLVGVEGLGIQRASGRGLARAHEPDEDGQPGRLHPIRSV